MIIDKTNCFRVRVASNRNKLRTPQAIADSYRTGDKMVAIRSAIKDIESEGGEFAFLVERYSELYGWVEVQCGEMVNGVYFPRNNM